MRREERLAVDERARLHPNDWSSLEVRVLDLSSNGFRGECEARVLVGTCVTLEVPGIGPSQAYVTWRRGNRFGAQFSTPLVVSQTGCAPLPQEAVLGRMLVERAEARSGGLYRHEIELRRRILSSLPMVRIPRD